MKDTFPKSHSLARVVIENVSPLVEGGSYPFKRVTGDWIQFQADIFADSHDLVQAVIDIHELSTGKRISIPMEPIGNDRFEGTYQSNPIGLYDFQIRASIAHYATWLDGLRKKHQEEQDLEVEFIIGADILAKYKGLTKDQTMRSSLSDFEKSIRDKKNPASARFATASSPELISLCSMLAEPESTSVSSKGLFSIERKLAVFSTWYEFFPRSCTHDGVTHGTFIDAAKQLPRISEMGFNVVYFPPISPIGYLHRKGKNNSLVAGNDDVGSPWAIGSKDGGHTSIHPELGTEKDFDSFLCEAEMRGMEVALDIAFQCAPDHPWVKAHPEWFKWRPDGTVQYAENPPKKYQDILPINFESSDWENLWDELKSVFLYWIRKGVRIFRVDNPHTKSLPFWNWCILNIKVEYPDVLFLAEAFTRPKRKYFLAKAGFTQGYTYFTWRNNAQEMRAYLEELNHEDVSDIFWPNFWPNTPDILHEDLQSGNRAAFIGRYLLAATLSSNMGIYGPAYELLDSEPFPGKEENNHNEKYQLKAWDLSAPQSIAPEISRINQLRNSNEALQRTFNIRFLNTDNPSILAYLKTNFDHSNRLLIVVNMDWNQTQSGFIDLASAGLDQSIDVIDLFSASAERYHLTHNTAYIELDPEKAVGHVFEIL